MGMAEEMSEAVQAEIVSAIDKWMRSQDGCDKLVEMLRQAAQENEHHRKAGQLDPKVLLEPVTL